MHGMTEREPRGEETTDVRIQDLWICFAIRQSADPPTGAFQSKLTNPSRKFLTMCSIPKDRHLANGSLGPHSGSDTF